MNNVSTSKGLKPEPHECRRELGTVIRADVRWDSVGHKESAFSLNPIPDGWYHRRFWRHGPMDVSFETKEGVPAIRLATHDTASMLFRHVDVELDVYPVLSWQWYVEKRDRRRNRRTDTRRG